MNISSIPWGKDIHSIINTIERFAPREGIEAFISQMINWYCGRYVPYELRVKPNEVIQTDFDVGFLKKPGRDALFTMSQGCFECFK